MDAVINDDKTEETWTTRRIARVVSLTAAFLLSLYLFLIGLKIMGDAFKVLGGCEAGRLFDFINNPIAGLMVGILSTVLVQSSSTSTSIVVSLVGSGGLSVRQAVPVIMGANIGTTITSTLVACGQIANKEQFERAFSAATVHDMFNVLSVIVFLPIEAIFHPLEHLTSAMVSDGTASNGSSFKSPLDPIIKPVAKLFLQVDKNIIKKAAKGDIKCSQVDSIIKGGMFKGNTSDEVAGTICLVLSILVTIFALFCIVKILNVLLLSQAERAIKKALNLNGYVMMLVGAGVTFVVQSSSITTSVLTPMVGVDLIALEQMYPMVLGANIGTTGTAFIASMVSGKDEAVQIALCHLFFNIFGIIVWYPIHAMRRVPIKMARAMGYTASKIRWFPVAYILVLFVFVPGLLLGVSYMYEGNATTVAFAVIFTILIVAFVLAIFFWWFRMEGKSKALAWIDRRDSRRTIDLESGDSIEIASPTHTPTNTYKNTL